MSHYMTALAMRCRGVKPAQKIVLYWLADHHNSETGLCCPSLKTLADKCEISKATLTRHLSELEAAGLISRQARERENGSRTSTTYTLSLQPDPVSERDGPCLKMKQGPVSKRDTHNLGRLNLGNEPSFLDEDQDVSQHSLPATVDLFEQFWSVYPFRGGKKKGKAAARKAWDKAVKSVEAQEILDGARRYTDDRQARDGYAKDASTWINQQCWNDEIETGPRGGGGGKPLGRGGGLFGAAADLARELGAGSDLDGGGGGGDPWDTARDITPSGHDEQD